MEGWVNVPAETISPLRRIHLHAARPAGSNEPTSAGVFGAEKILSLVRSAGPRDVCICLLSGGGSALLPAPVDGVTLEEKQQITRLLHGSAHHQRDECRSQTPFAHQGRPAGPGLSRKVAL